MRLDTTTFSRGAVYDVRQKGNHLSVAPRDRSDQSAAVYDIVVNSGETASTIQGRDSNGAAVDYHFSYGSLGVTVTDNLKPGTTVSYASPGNYTIQDRNAQQSFAMNVVSSLIGVPLAFNSELAFPQQPS